MYDYDRGVKDEAKAAKAKMAPSARRLALEAKKKEEEDFNAFTSTKAHDLAQPLVVAQIPFHDPHQGPQREGVPLP